MNLGIIGCGTIGGALGRYLERQGHTVLREDPGMGLNDDLVQSEAIFVCVPVPTTPEGKQDTTILKSVLKRYRHLDRTPFYIRSTVLPKTTDHLKKFLKMRLYAMPEFLTAREADDCMKRQGIICGADIEHRELCEEQEFRLVRIFPGKTITLMSNREAELAKYAHNCMGAVKVNFFNLIRKYSETIGADYDSVRAGVLMTGYINEHHTQVPGPDGKYGFGGTCFPKDLAAFIHELKRLGLQPGSCEMTMFENLVYRTRWEKAEKSPDIAFPVLK